MINLLTPDFPDRLFHPGYCPFYLIKDCNYWYIMIIQWFVFFVLRISSQYEVSFVLYFLWCNYA